MQRDPALRLVRTLRKVPPMRHASSEAGPSSRPSKPLIKGQKLPRPVLRKLVETYHHSSTFLKDPSSTSAGFETAFRTIKTPYFQTYSDWSYNVFDFHSKRGVGGLSNLLPKHEDGVGAIRKDGEPNPVRRARSAFTGSQTWKNMDYETLSDREVRVKEALYGTWERGASEEIRLRRNDRVVEVALDGVEEYLGAKGKSSQQAAEEWKSRHQ